LRSEGNEFAFVVFGAATVADILTDPWGSCLTLAVALSLCVKPLLNRLEPHGKQDHQEADLIDQKNHGRFGQIARRLLMSLGVAGGYLTMIPTTSRHCANPGSRRSTAMPKPW
jgi:glutathione-regulated potassium-efflux system ancillary protein KefC